MVGRNAGAGRGLPAGVVARARIHPHGTFGLSLRHLNLTRAPTPAQPAVTASVMLRPPDRAPAPERLPVPGVWNGAQVAVKVLETVQQEGEDGEVLEAVLGGQVGGGVEACILAPGTMRGRAVRGRHSSAGAC